MEKLLGESQSLALEVEGGTVGELVASRSDGLESPLVKGIFRDVESLLFDIPDELLFAPLAVGWMHGRGVKASDLKALLAIVVVELLLEGESRGYLYLSLSLKNVLKLLSNVLPTDIVLHYALLKSVAVVDGGHDCRAVP